MSSTHKWELDDRVCRDLFTQWGTPTLDLFATASNSKCMTYSSRAGIGPNSLGDVFMEKVVLHTDPAFLPKVATPFHINQDIVVPAFFPSPSTPIEKSLHSLDVHRCLAFYRSHTESFRKTKHLFIRTAPLDGLSYHPSFTDDTDPPPEKEEISMELTLGKQADLFIIIEQQRKSQASQRYKNKEVYCLELKNASPPVPIPFRCPTLLIAAVSFLNSVDQLAMDKKMIDEDKSKENVSAFPMQSVINQSDAYHMNQSLANHSSVNINTAFILLPRRLGIQISSDDNKVQPDSYSKEEKECHNQKKGFASITITARRVIPPCKNKMQGNVSSSSCLKCQGSKLLTNIVSPSNVTGLDQLYGPLHVQGCCQNPNATEKRVSKPCPQLCKGKSYGITSPENRENRLVPPGNNLNKEAQISFTSSVHLSISQQCPNTIYYVDKSLLVPVDQPQTKNQKIHRSVVSFNINCSSPTLTPDGVDGLANGKLITDVLKTKLPEDSKTPLKAIWNAYLKENNWVKKQTLETDSLGTEYLWKGTSPSETLSVVDSPQGLDNLRPTKSNDVNSSDNHITLSPHISHGTYSKG
ncbi:(E2-independent) E3 ubiquitin-conjugating enzyme FATS [Varanus komodoensis]|nr:(E2-independent) E3 ubiquitin-conjugating enzyme FATS [Varanus komodoensis]